MNIVDKYEYKELKRETSKKGPRIYLTPAGNRVPSVTTVLSGTKDMTFLKEWRKRVGNAEADNIVKRSINYGNTVHQNLEDYILEGKEPTGNVFALHMTKQIINKGLSKVDEIWDVKLQYLLRVCTLELLTQLVYMKAILLLLTSKTHAQSVKTSG